MRHYFSGNDYSTDEAMDARLFSYWYLRDRRLPWTFSKFFQRRSAMRVYMAGYMSFLGENAEGVDITRSAPVESVLESFYYMDDKKLKLSAESDWHILLDSGAYSAFSRGATILVDEYAEFIQRTREHWDLIAGLDVIGDAHASWHNFERMRNDYGILTVPTFHYGEPWEFLDKMVAEAPYIAIGGVAQLGSGPALTEWLDSVWSNHLVDAEGRRKVDVHGFAVTGKVAMLRYPWTSVDSTSWLQMAGHGTVAIDLPNGRGGITDIKVAMSEKSPHVEVDGKHYDTMKPVEQAAVRSYLEGLGYNIQDIREKYRWRQHVNIGYFRRMEARGVDRFVRTQPGLFF